MPNHQPIGHPSSRPTLPNPFNDPRQHFFGTLNGQVTTVTVPFSTLSVKKSDVTLPSMFGRGAAHQQVSQAPIVRARDLPVPLLSRNPVPKALRARIVKKVEELKQAEQQEKTNEAVRWSRTGRNGKEIQIAEGPFVPRDERD
jgi:hypothetical protein